MTASVSRGDKRDLKPSDPLVLFENPGRTSPKVSIVLLDWSCRESFHALRYLNEQSAGRESYEIIWIEYYSRRAAAIESALDDSKRTGGPPVLDMWIELGVPEGICYHKHLMYNVGLVASRGEIVTFCDSDAIFGPDFVKSIIESFEAGGDMALHMDEVRNLDRRFYPFNYPGLDEVRRGALNYRDGTTTGLLDTVDRLHTLNYGACMSARRSSLIEIGGADEHTDYLGHICGPYEMTFRLVNSGRKERWHSSEFLYHVWHPGTDGAGNLCGPHDGRNVSSTALEARRTGRVWPLKENPAIRLLRLNEDSVVYEPLIDQAMPDEEIRKWRAEGLFTGRRSFWRLKNFTGKPLLSLRLTLAFGKMLTRHFYVKLKKFTRKADSYDDILRKVRKAYRFLRNTAEYNDHVIEKCALCVKRLVADNAARCAIFGTDEVAEIFYMLARDSLLKIDAVFDYTGGGDFLGFKVMPAIEARGYGGMVVVAATVGADEAKRALNDSGVVTESIIIL